MLGAELRSLRKVMAVVLVALFFSVTAFAFSSVVQKNWHSKLEKGEYSGEHSSVFVIVAVEENQESTPTDVIISEPIQIIVATPDEVEEDVENTDETVGV